jgi:hypothetical protein
MDDIKFIEYGSSLLKTDMKGPFRLVEIHFSDAYFKTIEEVNDVMQNKFLGAIGEHKIVEKPGFIMLISQAPELKKKESEHIYVKIGHRIIKIYINFC